MALDIRVDGAAKLRKLAAQFRREGNKDLSREMSRAVSNAIEPIRRTVRASASEVMPAEGGYKAVFDKSLKFRTSQRGGENTAQVQLITYASGKDERRDIRALDKGNLRHPIFGRSRPGRHKGERVANPWAVTKIRAGFFKRGTDNAMDEVEKNLIQVADDFTRRLVE